MPEKCVYIISTLPSFSSKPISVSLSQWLIDDILFKCYIYVKAWTTYQKAHSWRNWFSLFKQTTIVCSSLSRSGAYVILTCTLSWSWFSHCARLVVTWLLVFHGYVVSQCPREYIIATQMSWSLSSYTFFVSLLCDSFLALGIGSVL